MVVCSVPGCATKGTKIFHSFPKNPDIRKLWVRITKTFHLTEKQLSSYAKVCKNHFIETDFELNARGQQGLKKDSVPTQNLPNELTFDDELNFALTDDQYVPRRRKHESHQQPEDVSEPLANPEYYETMHDNIGLQEVVLVDPNDVATISVSQMKEYEKIAEKNKLLEEQIMEYERIIKEMELTKKRSETMITNLMKKNDVNQKKAKKLRQELKNEMRQSNHKVMKYLGKIFNAEQLEFFSMQLKNSKKKPNGRRYTTEQKALSLILYKNSPKNYRFMQKVFVLPSKRTLGRYSAQLLFQSGVDTKLFAHIAEKVNSLSEPHKYCTLSWDEVSLKAHLDYNIPKDEIDGFVDMLNIRRPEFATHALTFMIRGMQIPFKQAVGFFFTNGLKHFELAEIIELVTKEILCTGLKVMTSVCDQVAVNVRAIHQLMCPNSPGKANGDLLCYEIQGNSIVHCFDPPHLIKGIRNNLMTKTLKHRITGRWRLSTTGFEKTVKKQRLRCATWDHIVALYRYNVEGSTRILRKITPEHINPQKTKMRVSVATQIFSQTVGDMMLKYASNGTLSKKCSDTAEILLFFNDLFDSVNGSREYDSDTLKGPVTESSIHFPFWNYALCMLSNMQFHDKLTGRATNKTRVLNHFKSTIKGYMEISRRCLNMNLTNIEIRNMNQDGLENFFGCVRSQCHNSSSLIVPHFRSAYASIFVTNTSCVHSMKSNCEPDIFTPLLTNVHHFFLKYNEDQTDLNDTSCTDETDDEHESDIFDPLHNFTDNEINVVNNEAVNNVSSLVCDKMMKIIKCENCRKSLETSVLLHANCDDIDAPKEPSDLFKANFMKLVCAMREILPEICTEKCLRQKLVQQLDKIDIDAMGCSKHYEDVTAKFKEQTAFYGIVSFIKNINDLLSGKNAVLPSDYNYMEKLAFMFKQKNKGIGKYSEREKVL